MYQCISFLTETISNLSRYKLSKIIWRVWIFFLFPFQILVKSLSKNQEILCSEETQRLKMRKIVSRTMSLIGVALLIHFIILSTFAERDDVNAHKSPSLLSSSSLNRRRSRSFRLSDGPKDELNDKNNENVENFPQNQLIWSSSGLRSESNKIEAVFTTPNSTEVTAQEGSTANLPCIVRNLGNGVASWMRRRDYSLLTVGMGTITHDERFYVSHSRTTQNWELHVKFVRRSDEGVYECQISTHPPSSIYITLRVVEARGEILGEPDKHVRSGSSFELICVLRDSTEPPVYVFWYHNGRMINYDTARGVVVRNERDKSVLFIEDAQKGDSGNYSCTPSNARPTTITVHILNGEKPAAMQHGSRNSSNKLIGLSWILNFIIALILISNNLRFQNPHKIKKYNHNPNSSYSSSNSKNETLLPHLCPIIYKNEENSTKISTVNNTQYQSNSIRMILSSILEFGLILDDNSTQISKKIENSLIILMKSSILKSKTQTLDLSHSVKTR